ncbi:hypothetical protein IIB79_02005 [candidate division KSB1 bacterium]|nr:hypothetical protein [candidate division KSB1 bacterium]
MLFVYINEGYSQTIDPDDPLVDGSNVFGIMFFGRQPSARAEAMGKNFMAADGSIYSAFYNPAALSFNKGVSFSYSNSSPFYLLRNAEYNFAGGAYASETHGSFGFSYYRYNPHFESSGLGISDYRQKITLYTFSYTYEPIPLLRLGVNINIFTDWNKIPLFDGPSLLDPTGFQTIKRRAIFPDIGILKISNFSRANLEHVIIIGSSLNNAIKSDIKLKTKDVGPADEELPVTFHIGASYESSLNRRTGNYNLKTLSWFLTAEYQEILNSKYRGGFKFGAEITGLEMLKLRMGYYREKLPYSRGWSDSKKYLTDFTYGAGVFVPLSIFSDNSIPLDFGIDFVKKDHALFTNSNLFSIGDFTVMSFTVTWKFD